MATPLGGLNAADMKKMMDDMEKGGMLKGEARRSVIDIYKAAFPMGIMPPALPPVAPGAYNYAEDRTERYPSQEDLLKMIAMRMRWSTPRREGKMIPKPFDEYFAAHKMQNGEDVHVFLIVDGKPITITEPWGLFPSDALVTQLRLLEEK